MAATNNVNQSSMSKILGNLWSFIFGFIIKPIVSFFSPWTGVQDQSDINVKPTSAIPGPYAWPILGDALSLKKFGGAEGLLVYASQLHKKYGSIFKTKLGPEKLVFVNNAVLYKEILRSEPRCPLSFKPPAGEAFNKIHKINRGLFFQDGEQWYRGRSLLTQLLLKDTGRFMGTVFRPVEKVIQDTVADLASKSVHNDGVIASIEQECYKLFLSSIMAVTYGRNYAKFLSTADSDVSTLGKMAKDLLNATYDMKAFPIPIAIALGLNYWKRYQELMMYNLTTGHKTTDAALEAMNNAENGGSLEEFGLLHRMKTVCNASVEDIRIHCTDFTVDISDPVSISTLWTLYALGRNPNVQLKILAEIESVCGTEQRPVTYKDLETMKYLNGTFKEVFRMFPTAPLLARNLSQDMVIGGYKITPDHTLCLSISDSHKNPEYFSEPEKFWPERWLGDEIDAVSGVRLKCEDAYHPFGMGRRSCAGKLIVSSLIKLYIAEIVRHFIVESDEVKIKLKFILYPDEDIKIKLTPRSNKKNI